MRPSATIILALILVNSVCQGQRHINGRIIDSLTNKPLAKFAFYILRDNDKWIDIGYTDSAGYFKGEIDGKELNKKSSYQVSVDNDAYNLAIIDVTALQGDTVLIKLTKNENYIPRVRGKTYRDCSQTSFGDYEPKEPRTLSDLPKDVAEKVTTHIRDRVGSNFYSRLSLTSGQIVDLKRLEKIENFSKEYKWKAYSYYLCFSFSDTSTGIARFTAKIVLDENGEVGEEIELPKISTDSSKGQIISMQTAFEIAAKNNYLESNSSIDFDYDRKADCFVWTFKKSTYNKDHTMYYNLLIISAHTGQVLKDGIGGAGIWH